MDVFENFDAPYWDNDREDYSETISIEELIRFALIEADREDEFFPSAYGALMRRGNQEVFDRAKSLINSQNSQERTLGANLLGSLGDILSKEMMARITGQPVKKSFPEAIGLLLELAEREQSPDVLAAIGTSFGHIRDDRGIEPLLRFKNHPDEAVRFGAAWSLGHFEDDRAIKALIELSQDVDDDTRNWATFGLCSYLRADTPEIRAALIKNLDDPFEDVRQEAMAGLAARRVREAIPSILDELESNHSILSHVLSEVCEMLTELQDEITDPRLPQLLEAWDCESYI